MGSSASLEEVRAAAKEAQIDDFIIPAGWLRHQGGQLRLPLLWWRKQRIAIARAI